MTRSVHQTQSISRSAFGRFRSYRRRNGYAIILVLSLIALVMALSVQSVRTAMLNIQSDRSRQETYQAKQLIQLGADVIRARVKVANDYRGETISISIPNPFASEVVPCSIAIEPAWEPTSSIEPQAQVQKWKLRATIRWGEIHTTEVVDTVQ